MLETACRSCGTINPLSFRFCVQCGRALKSDGALPNLPRAEQLRHEAERRQITILFSDIVGSTAISRQLDPEDLRDLLTEYRSVVADVIEGLGGNVARYIGDGVLAFFGYPTTRENDAARAVRAGLDIIRRFKSEADSFRTRYGSEIRLRIGIHTGVVIVGDLESGSILEHMSVVGEAPNIAARLQEMAEPDTVVVGELTARLVGSRLALRPLGERALRGVDMVVQCFEAYDPTPADALRRMLDPVMTRLYGREREWEQLWSCWTAAAAGAAQFVAISGEAGIGKSRLLRELREKLAGARHRWFDLIASPLEETTPFAPVLGSIRRDVVGMGAKTPEAMTARLIKLVDFTIGGTHEVTELLADFIGLPWDRERVTGGWSAQRKRRRLIEGLVAFVLAQTRREPTVVAVEDVHWMDASSRELLDELIRQGQGHPLLIVVTHRPRYAGPWPQVDGLTQIRLNALSPEAVDSMIREIASSRLVSSDMSLAISRRCDGLPLYVEELTRAVIDRKTTPRSQDEHSILPETLRESLMERVDRSVEGKLVLQCAAVIGRHFDYETVHHLAGLSAEWLELNLEQLVNAGILFQRGFPPRASYSFKHSLLRDAAYDSMLQRQRRHLHAELAAYFGETRAGSVIQPELIAFHYAQADLVDNAVIHYLEAARHARQRLALEEAAAHAEQALTLLPRVKGQRAQHEMQARLTLGEVLLALKGYASTDAQSHFTRALAISEALDERESLISALWGLGGIFHVRGPVEKSEQLTNRLVQLAEEAGDPLRLGEAKRREGLVALTRAQFDRADACFAASDALLAANHADSLFNGSRPYLVLLANAAWCAAFKGRWAEADAKISELMRLATLLSDPYARVYGSGIAAAIEYLEDNAERGSLHAEECVRVSAEQLFVYWKAWGEIFAGWADGRRGLQGMARLEGGIEVYSRASAAQLLLFARCLQASVHLSQGEAEAALFALTAVDTEALGFTYMLPERMRLQGLSMRALKTGDGLDALRGSVRLAREAGALTLEARALTSLLTALPQGTERDQTGERLQVVLAAGTWREGSAIVTAADRALGALGGLATA